MYMPLQCYHHLTAEVYRIEDTQQIRNISKCWYDNIDLCLCVSVWLFDKSA